jgi:ankyrin repeat protein
MLSILLAAAALAGSPELGSSLKRSVPCPEYDLLKAVRFSKQPSCFANALTHMSVNETDAAENTPLHLAILARNEKAVAFLLAHGADLNWRNQNNRTPRELAEAKGYRALAEHFANLEKETERLARAVEYNDTSAAESSFRRGALVGLRDSRMDTLLHRAAQSGFVEMAKLLIAHGAEISARNHLGETPLHAAALRDHAGVMKALIEAGADPKAMNFRRETIADLTSGRGSPAVLSLLMKYKVPHGCGSTVSLEVSSGDGEAPVEIGAPR